MSEAAVEPILKRRPRRAQGRHGRVLSQALRPAADRARAVARVDAGTLPPLGFREPESTRGALVSGSIAAALHAAVILLLIWIGANAKQVIQEITIPVEILHEPVELPGSTDPAPAGPKAISARAPAAAAAMAAALARAPVPQEGPAAPTNITANPVQMQQIRAARAPRQIDRRQLEAARLDAASATATAPSRLDVATLSPVKVTTGDVVAPKVNFGGPTQIETGGPSAAGVPQAFAGFQDVGSGQYQGQVVATGSPSAGVVAGSAGGGGRVGAAVSGAFVGGDGFGSGGGGGGGGGSGTGTVACMDSAYVQRYLDQLKNRTNAIWKVPEETPENSKVVIAIRLDITGTIVQAETIAFDTEELGRSAAAALRLASPFPHMDENNRCLAAFPFTMTFYAEETQ